MTIQVRIVLCFCKCLFNSSNTCNLKLVFAQINSKCLNFSDPYVTGDLGTARLFKTKYINNDLNPEWNEKFDLYVCHHASSFNIRIKDKEHAGAEFVAQTKIDAASLESGDLIEGTFELYDEGGEEPRGQIELSVQYIPKADLNENSNEMPNSYFDPRDGCRFVLYQDADTPQLPQFDGLCHTGKNCAFFLYD